MNAIDALGKKAAPLYETLKTMAVNDPKADTRDNWYVDRLRAKILGEPAKKPAAAKKKAAGRKKKVVSSQSL